ncbi:MAG: hypothetical protein KAJ07_04635 [Planctomycetes bacterium]|nr:hypothetical protein [Planctomycetota bacterium]
MPNKNITLELGRILCTDTGTACRVIQQLIEDRVSFRYAANEEDEEYPHVVHLIDAGNLVDVHGLFEKPIDLAIVRAINAANATDYDRDPAHSPEDHPDSPRYQG